MPMQVFFLFCFGFLVACSILPANMSLKEKFYFMNHKKSIYFSFLVR